MPQVKVEFTPVRARRGKVVHATSMVRPTETVCRAKFSGWLAVSETLSCRNCKAALSRGIR